MWLTQGNDGGSIAKRDDLVRTKAAANDKVDKDEVRHSLWSQCRLTKKPLSAPIMADRLGQLYNKDGVIEYLLRRAQDEATDVENKAAGHIKGLKDVRQVKLTQSAADEDDDHAYPFSCPLTQRALTGKFKTVCLWPCGCVVSESGLRSTTGLQGKKDEPATPCPVCETPFSPLALAEGRTALDSDLVWLNPPEDEQSELRALLSQRKNKRKKSESGEKRAKPRLPTLNDAAPGAYAAQQVRVAQANAAHNAPGAKESEAISSLYRKTPSKRDVWLGKQAS